MTYDCRHTHTVWYLRPIFFLESHEILKALDYKDKTKQDIYTEWYQYLLEEIVDKNQEQKRLQIWTLRNLRTNVKWERISATNWERLRWYEASQCSRFHEYPNDLALPAVSSDLHDRIHWLSQCILRQLAFCYQKSYTREWYRLVNWNWLTYLEEIHYITACGSPTVVKVCH